MSRLSERGKFHWIATSPLIIHGFWGVHLDGGHTVGAHPKQDRRCQQHEGSGASRPELIAIAQCLLAFSALAESKTSGNGVEIAVKPITAIPWGRLVLTRVTTLPHASDRYLTYNEDNESLIALTRLRRMIAHRRYVWRPFLRHVSRFTSIFVFLVTLGLWQLVSNLKFFPAFALPSPIAVFHAFVLLFSKGYGGRNALADIWVSSLRIIIGFAGATILGVPIGFLMARSTLAFRILDPYLQFIRPVPPLAYIPLLVVWFGIGELPKILLILLGTIPVIIIGTFSGVKATPPLRLSVARTLGASESQIFRYVILPSALPDIFIAARVGIGVAWTCLVAAELIAADAGLGWLVQYAGEALQVAVVMAGITMIGILGYTMELVIRLIEQKLIPWIGHDET